MTYCVAMSLDAGMIFASDSRTNAGVDQIARFSKMRVFAQDGYMAVDFANRQSAPARCALVFPAETFELDIENRGNALIVLVEGAKRLLSRVVARQRT